MTPSVIDVPPPASPHVARAITTPATSSPARLPRTRAGPNETGWRQFTARAKSLGLEPSRGTPRPHRDLAEPLPNKKKAEPMAVLTAETHEPTPEPPPPHAYSSGVATAKVLFAPPHFRRTLRGVAAV
jgi:hypothetical protein